MNEALRREAVLGCARDWLDTPYRHQASTRGVGTDCLGLIRGIWRDIYGAEPESPPAYTPDWAEIMGRETLLEAAARWLRPIERDAAFPGDVMLFRMHPHAPCKHIGILSSEDTFIHAYWGKSVVESYLVSYWRRRWSHSFSFPVSRPLSLPVKV